MDIKAVIRELLFEHDCVIIPGFGGFIGNFSPARLDKSTGTFFPPVKQITFNRNINHNDGLLISKISRTAALNYGDARTLVERFVENMTSRLAKGEKIFFDHLGCFRYNIEKNLEFEPEPNINYYTGSYGLDSFQCVPLKAYDVRKRVTRHIDRDPVRQAAIRRNILRAAVIIPVLALLVAVPLKTDLFRAKTEATSLNPLVTAEFENNRKAVDEAMVIVPDSSPSVKREPVQTPSPPPPQPIEQNNYRIITGSFKSEQNAIAHVNALKADGYNPEIIQATNGFFRVTAMTCSDMETALATRDSISKRFPGSWISKK